MSECECAICLSPVQKRRFSKGGIYKTRCCHNVFHKDCLKRHKEQACASPATGVVRPRACPLCRSLTPTGLTPSTRPHVRGAPASIGGFVSGLALHGEMVRRASAARSAVQRSLLRAAGQQPRQQQPAASPASASEQRVQPTPPPPLPQPQPQPPGLASGAGFPSFFSPGGAYASIAPPPRHGQQLESRFQVAEQQQEEEQAAHAQGGGDMALDLN